MLTYTLNTQLVYVCQELLLTSLFLKQKTINSIFVLLWKDLTRLPVLCVSSSDLWGWRWGWCWWEQSDRGVALWQRACCPLHRMDTWGPAGGRGSTEKHGHSPYTCLKQRLVVFSPDGSTRHLLVKLRTINTETPWTPLSSPMETVLWWLLSEFAMETGTADECPSWIMCSAETM